MDVNEKIVIAWLKQCKNMFTRTNITYGQFHWDIDVLAINPIQNTAWDCEIKIRTGSTMISNNENKQNGFIKFTETLQDPVRNTVVHSLVPEDYKTHKMFITTKSLFGKTIANQKKWESRFNKKKIEVIFFEEVINDLFNFAKKSKKSENEIIQAYRLLNLYGDK